MNGFQVKASVRVHHERVFDFDEQARLWLRRIVDEDEIAHNLVTFAGRVQLASFGYGTVARANGFNYVALTNDGAAPSTVDTSLTGELAADGLGRAQGVVALPVSPANIVTITKVFTFTGAAQSVQKTALFDAAAFGVMNHEIQFTPRALVTSDTLTLVFSITVS